jgi:hypothetical protein
LSQHAWKQAGKQVKYIRLDNAGENKKLKTRSDSADWKLNIDFGFTSRDTPQQNHLVAELGFATIANRGRAVMHRANVPLATKYKLWRNAFKTATLLDGLMPININGITATRYKQWGGQNPAFAKPLKTWGEAGTVKLKIKATPRVADRGVQCMMVGYALNHDGDCYRMWDPKTARVHETRDVTWLHRMFFQQEVPATDMAMEPIAFAAPVPEDRKGVGTDEKSDTEDAIKDDDDSGGKATLKEAVTQSGRITSKPMQYIEEIGATASDYEIGLTMSEIRYYASMKEFPEGEFAPGEIACVGAGLGGGFSNTSKLHVMKYNKAMATENASEWSKAVDQEHDRMVESGAWMAVPKESVPQGEKILTSTWAMKKKSNGVYRARLNARGYEQVDGEHYKEDNKAVPVVNDTTFHILLILMLMASWSAEVLDVKGAFLHGGFEDGEQIYMGVPEGFEKHYTEGHVLLLLHTL